MFQERYRRMNEQIYPDPGLVNGILEEGQRGKKKARGRFYRPAVALVAILACLFTAVPVLAAISPVYELLYAVAPDVAQFFKPVQKSCVDNGIRMQVESAYIHGDTAEIYVSMQDLTQDRVDETTDLYDSYSIHRPFDSVGTCGRVGYDEKTRTATFLIEITEWGGGNISGEKITFSVAEFLSRKQSHDDVPIVVDWARLDDGPETELVDAIGGDGEYGSLDAPVKVLVPGEPMEFPVEGIELTGIGYVDGALHVQIAVRDRLSNDNHGFLYLKDRDGKELSSDGSVMFIKTAEDGARVDYIEYVFDVPEEEARDVELFGTFTTSGLRTQGNWQVTFPLEPAEDPA